jgi:MFS family permease
VGIASAGFPLGASIGPYVGGLIAQGPGIRTLLFLDGCLSAAVGLMLTLIIREQRRTHVSGKSSRLLLAAVRDITASPTVARLFLLYFIAMYGLSQVSPFIPILLQRLYRGPMAQLPTVIGTTLTASGIAMAVTTPLWGKLGDLIGRWRVLPICLGAVGLGLVTGGLVASLLSLQAAIVWIGLFQGGIGTTVIALLALLAPEERRASILNFSLLPSQLSWFIGPITGAALAGVWLQLPFLTGALALGAAMVLAFYNMRTAGIAER